MDELAGDAAAGPRFGDRAVADFEQALKRLLDSHGYSFQYATLQAFDRLVRSRHLDWHFLVAEFPVENGGSNTRLDFVVGQNYGRLILACECKRANPAISNWVFLKAPYRMNQFGGDNLAIEYMRRRPEHAPQTRVYTGESTGNGYDLAFELKGWAKGDADGGGRGAIEEACTQIIRGQQGYFNFMTTLAPTIQKFECRFVIPVVFTTATLWAGAPDLHMADFATGVLPEAPAVTRQPWVWYQFPISPALRHAHGRAAPPKDAGAALRDLYTRSIAVVSAAGLEDFLQQLTYLSVPKGEDCEGLDG